MSPFTNGSLRWLPGEPSDSGFCAYLEEPQVLGLRANPCTATAHGLICEKAIGERYSYKINHIKAKNVCLKKFFKVLFCLRFVAQKTPVTAPVHPARSPAHYTQTVPTVPAKPWSVCGVAAHTAAWTPLHTSSLFPTASVWSGRRQIVWVSTSH